MYPVSDGEYFGMYGNCFLTDWLAGDIFLPSFMEGGHELGSAEVDEPVFCRLYGKIGYKNVPFSRFVVRKSPWLSVARWFNPRCRNWTTWHCHPVCRRSSCRHRNSRPHHNWNRARFSDWSSHWVKSKDHLRLGNGSYAKSKFFIIISPFMGK